MSVVDSDKGHSYAREKMRAKTRVSAPRVTKPTRRRAEHARSIRGNPFLQLLDSVKTEVESRLSGFFDARLDDVAGQGSEVTDLVGSVRDLTLRGGKRLRPGLLLAGYRAAAPEADAGAAWDAGMALELLHAYFLIHDDWMDQDAVRRGKPAVHTMLAKKYRSNHIGAASAVLAGDMAACMATEVIGRVDVPPRRLPSIVSTFARIQADAIMGQQLDVHAHENIERTYALKTGSYTVRGPLVLGALLAGGSSKLVLELERFATPVGIAFQLRDDLLSAFGDPARTGKPFGNDIRTGKRTLVVEYACQMAIAKDRADLRRILGNERATKRELERAMAILERSGARSRVEQRIEELLDTGLSALDGHAASPVGRELLVDAARALAHRKH